METLRENIIYGTVEEMEFVTHIGNISGDFLNDGR